VKGEKRNEDVIDGRIKGTFLKF